MHAHVQFEHCFKFAVVRLLAMLQNSCFVSSLLASTVVHLTCNDAKYHQVLKVYNEIVMYAV